MHFSSKSGCSLLCFPWIYVYSIFLSPLLGYCSHSGSLPLSGGSSGARSLPDWAAVSVVCPAEVSWWPAAPAHAGPSCFPCGSPSGELPLHLLRCHRHASALCCIRSPERRLLVLLWKWFWLFYMTLGRKVWKQIFMSNVSALSACACLTDIQNVQNHGEVTTQ